LRRRRTFFSNGGRGHIKAGRRKKGKLPKNDRNLCKRSPPRRAVGGGRKGMRRFRCLLGKIVARGSSQRGNEFPFFPRGREAGQNRGEGSRPIPSVVREGARARQARSGFSRSWRGRSLFRKIGGAGSAEHVGGLYYGVSAGEGRNPFRQINDDRAYLPSRKEKNFSGFQCRCRLRIKEIRS